MSEIMRPKKSVLVRAFQNISLVRHARDSKEMLEIIDQYYDDNPFTNVEFCDDSEFFYVQLPNGQVTSVFEFYKF